MNKLINFCVLVLTLIPLSCTDRGFNSFKLSIFFNNLSGHALNIIFFTNQEIDTIQIDNLEKYHYGLFDYDAPLPLDNCDSIFIHFDDNKAIKYLPGDCVEKNIFCTSTYYCITADTSVCQFIIDLDEYLKAE